MVVILEGQIDDGPHESKGEQEDERMNDLPCKPLWHIFGKPYARQIPDLGHNIVVDNCELWNETVQS